MTMTPHMKTPVGDIIKVIRLISDSAEPQSFSIVGGVFHMLSDGDLFLAIVIAGFSIIFPSYKLLTMHRICGRCLRAENINPKKLDESVHLLAKLGKWSMLDVFVLGLIVLSFKAFPGGTTINLNFGAYAFGASVLVSMFATSALKNGVDARHNTPSTLIDDASLTEVSSSGSLPQRLISARGAAYFAVGCFIAMWVVACVIIVTIELCRDFSPKLFSAENITVGCIIFISSSFFLWIGRRHIHRFPQNYPPRVGLLLLSIGCGALSAGFTLVGVGACASGLEGVAPVGVLLLVFAGATAWGGNRLFQASRRAA